MKDLHEMTDEEVLRALAGSVHLGGGLYVAKDALRARQAICAHEYTAEEQGWPVCRWCGRAQTVLPS